VQITKNYMFSLVRKCKYIKETLKKKKTSKGNEVIEERERKMRKKEK